jgi:hypothetical protein
MLLFLLILLAFLWFFGYIHIAMFAVPDLTLFAINGHPVTLWNLLIFFVIAAIIGVLPNPFRAIAGVFLVLWVLAVLGIFAFAGMSSILVVAIIVGLLAYIVSGFGAA